VRIEQRASQGGTLAQLWRALLNDLRRLNSARLGKKALAKLPHREKSRAVKAALKAYHQNKDRCC
jgi:hypothetical protein